MCYIGVTKGKFENLKTKAKGALASLFSFTKIFLDPAVTNLIVLTFAIAHFAIIGVDS